MSWASRNTSRYKQTWGGSFLQSLNTPKDVVSQLRPILGLPPRLRRPPHPDQVGGDQAALYWLLALPSGAVPPAPNHLWLLNQQPSSRTDSPESFHHEDSVFLSCLCVDFFFFFWVFVRRKTGGTCSQGPKQFSKLRAPSKQLFSFCLCVGALKFWVTQTSKNDWDLGEGCPQGLLLEFSVFSYCEAYETENAARSRHQLQPKLHVCIFPFICIPFLVSTPLSTPCTSQLSFSIANDQGWDLNKSRSYFLCARPADNCITIWDILHNYHQLWNKLAYLMYVIWVKENCKIIDKNKGSLCMHTRPVPGWITGL